MKKRILLWLVVLLPLCLIEAEAQDVIFLNTGEVIHAKVSEVRLYTIHYRRADNPEGPIYELLKEEVYAIAYGGNLRTEYFDQQATNPQSGRRPDRRAEQTTRRKEEDTANILPPVSNPSVGVALGFVRSYTRGEEGRDFVKPDGIGPALILSFSTELNPALNVGVQAGFAQYSFSGSQLNEFDQLRSEDTVNESVASLGIFGKYSLDWPLVKPYVLGGLLLNTSRVTGKRELTFVEQRQVIEINNTARYANLGIMLRLGASLAVSNQFAITADVGTGVSILQVGVLAHFGE